MGRIRKPKPARLICAFMGSPHGPWGTVKERMVSQFGPVALESPSYPFIHSLYYVPEMGRDLIKFFWAFARPFPMDSLIEAKLFTNALEEELGEYKDGRLHRVVNLDPGYLTDAQLVLATTKGYSHRIYLGRGIYAEVTLVYRHGAFRPLEWTYPDYRMPMVISFLEEVRKDLLAERRRGG